MDFGALGDVLGLALAGAFGCAGFVLTIIGIGLSVSTARVRRLTALFERRTRVAEIAAPGEVVLAGAAVQVRGEWLFEDEAGGCALLSPAPSGVREGERVLIIGRCVRRAEDPRPLHGRDAAQPAWMIAVESAAPMASIERAQPNRRSDSKLGRALLIAGVSALAPAAALALAILL